MHYLKFSQNIPLPLEKAWSFFSSPDNLKILTPDYLKISLKDHGGAAEMYPGQIIAYTLYPLWNIPVEWVSEITHVHKPHYFIDQQCAGPYKFWHHEHRFHTKPDGVEIVDIIYYQLPFGVLGKALNSLKVEKELRSIFKYRQDKLEEMFGVYPRANKP